jgi:hypothetical protein
MSSSHALRRHNTLPVVAMVLLSATGSRAWADEPIRHIDKDPGLAGSLASLGRGLARSGRNLIARPRSLVKNLRRKARAFRRASTRDNDTWLAAARETFSSYQEPSSKRPTFKQRAVPVVTTVASALLTAYAFSSGADPFASSALAIPATYGVIRLMNLRDQAKRARSTNPNQQMQIGRIERLSLEGPM